MGKKFEMKDKRVVGFISHSGSGKTSIAEAMLFNAKATERLGSVESGQSALDYEQEEIKRKYSVSTSFFDLTHKNSHIFLIDAPGNSNFIPESFSILPAFGAAIIAVDSVDGVKYQTEIATKKLKEHNIPQAVFITKLDKEHTNFDAAVEQVKNSLEVEPVLFQIPIGKEDDFKGVVDLLSNKAYIYETNGSGKAKAEEIPGDLKDQAESLRSELIERLVEADDEIMEKFLEGEEISEEEINLCMKKGFINNDFAPILLGVPTKNMGINLLLDFIVNACPNPAEEPARTLEKLDSDETEELVISEDGNFVAQVLKTLTDPFAGRINIFRVYRGKVTQDGAFYNIAKNSKDKFTKIFYQRGKKQEGIEEATAGDIFAAVKLKDVETGDTLIAAENDNVKMCSLPVMAPMVWYSVAPKTQGEEEKMTQALNKVIEEDPNLKLQRNDETKEFILAGLGQAQIDVAMEKMKRKYNAEVLLSTPKIPYRETIKGKAEVQGKFKKQSGGRGQYGDCHIRVEPLPREGGFEFVDSIVGGVIPKQFIPAVEKGILEAMEKGILTGSQVQDVRVELFYGSYHTVDSSENAFKSAGRLAWKKSMEAANPVLLEPIYKLTITVPGDCMGDVYGYISSHRGKVQGSEEQGGQTVIFSEIPQAEMGTIAADLRAMTGDRQIFVAEFDHYEEVPPAIAEKIIAESKREDEEE